MSCAVWRRLLPPWTGSISIDDISVEHVLSLPCAGSGRVFCLGYGPRVSVTPRWRHILVVCVPASLGYSVTGGVLASRVSYLQHASGYAAYPSGVRVCAAAALSPRPRIPAFAPCRMPPPRTMKRHRHERSCSLTCLYSACRRPAMTLPPPPLARQGGAAGGGGLLERRRLRQQHARQVNQAHTKACVGRDRSSRARCAADTRREPRRLDHTGPHAWARGLCRCRPTTLCGRFTRAVTREFTRAVTRELYTRRDPRALHAP